MKRNLFSILCFLCVLCAQAQDWNGRVYMCTQTDDLRQYIITQMTSDPDYEQMGYEEKQFMSILFNCMDVKMGMKFKKDNKVTTSFYLSLNSSRFSQSGMPAFARDEINRQIQQMQSDMKETSSYSVSGKTLTIDGDEFAISDDEKEYSIQEGDVTLTFKRK